MTDALRVAGALVTSLVIIALSGSLDAEENVWVGKGPEGGSVGSIAIDPTDPSTVYVNANGGTFRSTNGGASWALVDGARLPGFEITIDRETATTLYAVNGAVFKSVDGGVTWDNLSEGTASPSPVDARTLVIDPQNPNVLYVSTYFSSAVANHGVLKSIDGGQSWSEVNQGFDGRSINALAVDPLNSNVVYAGGSAMFKSTNGGGSWDELAIDALEITSLAIDPATPTTVYAATAHDGVLKTTTGGEEWEELSEDLPRSVEKLVMDPVAFSTLYAVTNGRRLFKTTNGGVDWNTVDDGIADRSVLSVAVDPEDPSTLYAGTASGGAFKSSSGGASWISVNTGLTATAISALAFDPGGTLYAASFIGVLESSDGGTTWGSTVDPATRGANVLAIGPGEPRSLYVGTDGGDVLKTTDAGATWTPVNDGRPVAQVAALVGDPKTEGTIYAGLAQYGVFKTENAGTTWDPVNDGLPEEPRGVHALAIDPATPSTLYAVIDFSGVYKTTNGGDSWTPANVGLPNAFGLNTLTIDPTASGTLYVGTNVGVYKSTNGAATWSAVNSGLSHLHVFVLAIDPDVPGRLYAETYLGGLYATTNGGSTWRPVPRNGLPAHRIVEALAIRPGTGTLYAGTLGGLFTLDRTDAESVSVLIGPGGVCSTDTEGASGTADGATPDDPIETTVRTPNAGVCEIAERPATGVPLSGFSLFGQAVTLGAPAASPLDRLEITFVLDASLIPPGQRRFAIRLLKDGVEVQRCPGPDPCMFAPTPLLDGDVRLVVSTSTASVWSPVVAMLDSYLCYASAPTKGADAVAPSPGHLLADALDAPKRYDLTKPGALCLPAVRDGAPVTDGATALHTTVRKAGKVCSDTGLACKKKQECAAPATCDAQAKFPKRSGIRVYNALGAMVVEATKPTTVLLPSATSASDPPDIPNPAVDTFACYATKPQPKVCTGDPTRACTDDTACGDAAPCFAAFPKDLAVHLDEAVATPDGKLFAVKKPTQLCLPAELDGKPRKVPSVALQCYAIAPAKKQPKHAPIGALPITSPPLGDMQRDTKKESEVCVPSEVYP